MSACAASPAIARLGELINDSVPDCTVTGFEPLIAGLELPDMDDRHVLAAAITAGAQVIVTHNLRHFPSEALAPFSIEAQHPDEFVLNLVGLSPRRVMDCVEQQAASLPRPAMSIDEMLDALEANGLVASTVRPRQTAAP